MCFRILLLCSVILVLSACNYRWEKLDVPADMAPTFSAVQRFVLGPKCLSCHAGSGSPMGIDLSTYESIMKMELVVPEQPEQSPLYVSIASGRMPKGRPLGEREQQLVFNWIQAGASKTGGPLPKDPPPTPTYDWISKYVFARRCVGCHDGSHSETRLDLRTYESLMSYSGELFKAVEPGDPEFSLLMITLESGTMPPEGEKLSQEVLEAIESWIQTGASKEAQ